MISRCMIGINLVLLFAQAAGAERRAATIDGATLGLRAYCSGVPEKVPLNGRCPVILTLVNEGTAILVIDFSHLPGVITNYRGQKDYLFLTHSVLSVSLCQGKNVERGCFHGLNSMAFLLSAMEEPFLVIHPGEAYERRMTFDPSEQRICCGPLRRGPAFVTGWFSLWIDGRDVKVEFEPCRLRLTRKVSERALRKLGMASEEKESGT
ncbi:hypothetical protein JW905_11030 [bacterium]|nr:hypothetical protein [candidate division CSSED10-310 bacterium]